MITADDVAVEALGDAETYREIALLAIARLHDLTVERDRLRKRHYRLQHDYRDLRERVTT